MTYHLSIVRYSKANMTCDCVKKTLLLQGALLLHDHGHTN